MGHRKIQFTEGEFYHVFNHGIDQKNLFLDPEDLQRFLLLLIEFNDDSPMGGISHSDLNCNNLRHQVSQIVRIVCYCLNLNHFHLLLEQVSDRGVEKFMQRICNGYAKYYNHKYKRSGPLFRGPFRASHVISNGNILKTSAYINLNNEVHKLSKDFIFASSWLEYVGESKSSLCFKEIILGQFKDKDGYKNYALDLLPVFREIKEDQRDLNLNF